MVRKPQEPWNRPTDNVFVRFLSGIDFSLQVILSAGVVILLCIVLFLVLRDRYETVNYMTAALHS